MTRLIQIALSGLVVCLSLSVVVKGAELERVKYNNPGLSVDLGVGLWAWPMPFDYDGDGDIDLLVGCPDKPYNGVYLFENPAGKGVKHPVFKPGRRLGKSAQNLTLSLSATGPRVLSANKEFTGFKTGDWNTTALVYPTDRVALITHLRENSWRFVDYDGDGRDDLLVGHDDWTDFGWFTTNDWWKKYDRDGKWTGGPLHGWVYWLKNQGTNDKPDYAAAQQVLAGGAPVDVYGRPVPNLADFDGDGDFDLLCGEFLDGFTWFENRGSRTEPVFAAGRKLEYQGQPLTMDLQMIVPAAIDFDGDGDIDLVVGDEDGRVALVENTGKTVDGQPEFLPPFYFQQEADDLKCGALATPVGFDWDGDGDDDIVSGNTSGMILFFENLSGPKVAEPRWNKPVALEAGGKVIRILAGPSGSIQGPAEAKWGYTTIQVCDWNQDGLPDIVANSILGRVHWYQNQGTRTHPKLAAAQPVVVAWNGSPPKPAWVWWTPEPNELVTQWRTTPVVVDFNGDSLLDLVMLDHEGYLAFFERFQDGDKQPLKPGARVLCDDKGNPLRLNAGAGGRSGRRKLTILDWDRDGRLDILANSQNAEFWKQTSREGSRTLFTKSGNVSERNIEGHDTSPTTVDWNGDGRRELIIGAEDGRFYRLTD